jgi:hypothetical protein
MLFLPFLRGTGSSEFARQNSRGGLTLSKPPHTFASKSADFSFTMHIWIDATRPTSTLSMFGMTLLERQLRTIKEAGLLPTTISVLLAPGNDPPSSLPDGLTRELPLQWSPNGGSLQEHLSQTLQQQPETPLLALEADAVVDARLLRHIGAQSGALVARGGEGAERTVVVRLESGASLAGPRDAQLCELADASLSQGTVRELPLQEVPAYIKKLRRDLPPYLFRVTDAAKRDEAERFLFWSNYKGSTDFFTKYVYPPLVWRMVRPLARWRVHPNVVTLISVVLTLWAVPLFARGQWVAGLLMAYSMSVLDSVDGKLARLTFRSSWWGNVLDHGLDLIHLPLWYFGWAWALGGGNIASPIFQAGEVPYILVDQVDYRDDGFWTTGADGTGASLQRRFVSQFGNDPANWLAAAPFAASGAGGAPLITTQPASGAVAASSQHTGKEEESASAGNRPRDRIPTGSIGSKELPWLPPSLFSPKPRPAQSRDPHQTAPGSEGQPRHEFPHR